LDIVTSSSFIAATFISATARYDCNHQSAYLYSNAGTFYGVASGTGYVASLGPSSQWHTCPN
jgi:hypothetical protein